MTTERYHRLSDEVLDHMVTKLEELADEIDMQGFDIEYNVSLVSRLQFCQKINMHFPQLARCNDYFCR